jgi:hypothetical protein
MRRRGRATRAPVAHADVHREAQRIVVGHPSLLLQRVKQAATQTRTATCHQSAVRTRARAHSHGPLRATVHSWSLTEAVKRQLCVMGGRVGMFWAVRAHWKRGWPHVFSSEEKSTDLTAQVRMTTASAPHARTCLLRAAGLSTCSSAQARPRTANLWKRRARRTRQTRRETRWQEADRTASAGRRAASCCCGLR